MDILCHVKRILVKYHSRHRATILRHVATFLREWWKKKLNCSVDFFLLKRETVKKRHVGKMKPSQKPLFDIYNDILKSTLFIGK